MYFVYCDESGDSGHSTAVTGYFTVVGLAVRDQAWIDCLKKIKAFRKHLQVRYNIPPRAELHATDIWNNRSTYRRLNLSVAGRRRLLREIVLFLSTLKEFRILVVSADKSSPKLGGRDIGTVAWKYFFQRFENFLKSTEGFGAVFPDKGDEKKQRTVLRRMRVYNPIPSKFGGFYRQEIVKILEDPNVRDSATSFFVQLADIVAWSCRLRDDSGGRHRFWRMHRLYKVLKPIMVTQAAAADPYGFVYIK